MLFYMKSSLVENLGMLSILAHRPLQGQRIFLVFFETLKYLANLVT